MTLDDEFESAAEKVKVLESMSNEDMLELYGYFKQAKYGDNKESEPWTINAVKHAKWKAWTKNKGMTTASAKTKYIEKVQSFFISSKK